MHVGWIKQTRLVAGPYPFIGWGSILLGTLVQIGALAAAVLFDVEPPRWMFLANAIFALPVALPCLFLTFRHRRAFIPIIRANDGRVCTSCGYPLEPTHDGKPCPECGTPINLAHFRKIWLKTLGGW